MTSTLAASRLVVRQTTTTRRQHVNNVFYNNSNSSTNSITNKPYNYYRVQGTNRTSSSTTSIRNSTNNSSTLFFRNPISASTTGTTKSKCASSSSQQTSFHSAPSTATTGRGSNTMPLSAAAGTIAGNCTSKDTLDNLDMVRSLTTLFLGTIFATSSLAAAYYSSCQKDEDDTNINNSSLFGGSMVHAEAVMATSVVSPPIHVSRGSGSASSSNTKTSTKASNTISSFRTTKKNVALNGDTTTKDVTQISTATSESSTVELKTDLFNPRRYNVSIRALRGGRLYMEDEYFVADEGHFAAVFDGHGGNGVSSVLKDRLYDKITTFIKNGSGSSTPAPTSEQTRKKYWDDDELEEDCDDDSITNGQSTDTGSIAQYVQAIRESITEVDHEVLADDSLENQGSTAVAVLVHEDPDSNQRTILSANVGDSRAILSRRRKAIDLTRDHKPNEEKERARILAMGETIEWDPFGHVYRVRNLSLSRAIGDKFAKPAISGEAEIKQFPLSDTDEFILLASDGLWDVMNSNEVVAFVHRRLEAPYRPRNCNKAAAPPTVDPAKVQEERRRLMSRYVAHEALLRGSADNICVVIVWLKDQL